MITISGATVGFSGIWPVRGTQRNDLSLAMCARQQQPAVKEQSSKTKSSPAKRVRGKRRPQSHSQSSPYGSVSLPSEMLAELRCMLKGYQFCSQIAQLSNCRVTKFTGIIFTMQPISAKCPDGLPAFTADLRQNSDLEVIGVPPALVQRAARKAGIAINGVPIMQMCAVFEKYGMDDHALSGGEDFAKCREEDIMLQMESWCDYGESLRTETDVLHPEGADLFLEPLSDILD